ncbi:Acetyl-coenzyme A carboxyl transferase beta chain [Clostridiaceae bacterium JG1575]|nr:Acetyl-coenzyme A carboxyl transferase beta chain [Clostridiaceae bacterium JG1575]
MNLKKLFRKSINSLEKTGSMIWPQPPGPGTPKASTGPMSTCPSCLLSLPETEFQKHWMVCSECGQHLRLRARERLAIVLDEGSFNEQDASLRSINFLSFPQYDEKLQKAQQKSQEPEGVVTGTGAVSGVPCAVFFMEPEFIMGSMGSVVGEKITRIFEYALKEGLPVVGFCASGGARMQEGLTSLMQMAKTSAAVKRHSLAGLFYLSVLTDPTTGGVTASFAMEADVIISEPGALIGFAGPRVIEDTLRKKLPEGFQRAQTVMNQGFLDNIVHRRNLKAYIRRILSLHRGEPCQP